MDETSRGRKAYPVPAARCSELDSKLKLKEAVYLFVLTAAATCTARNHGYCSSFNQPLTETKRFWARIEDHANPKPSTKNEKKQIGHHARPRRASATAPLRTGADTCKTGSGAGKHAGAKSDPIPRRTHSTKTWTPVTSHTADQQALLQGKFPMNLGVRVCGCLFYKELVQVHPESRPVALAEVDCVGNETSLLDCPSASGVDARCPNSTDATIVACGNTGPGDVNLQLP